MSDLLNFMKDARIRVSDLLLNFMKPARIRVSDLLNFMKQARASARAFQVVRYLRLQPLRGHRRIFNEFMEEEQSAVVFQRLKPPFSEPYTRAEARACFTKSFSARAFAARQLASEAP